MTEVERRIERKKYKWHMFLRQSMLITNLFEKGYSISDISKITKISEKGVAKRILGDENANIV